ncbi:uncharacterized protein LOC34622531 [Cyclospora cayetanensis]|uniref:Uncharacterized protein LOC34622531 n=1 Tax=Cyclospora cayetanensis TaxID=88456 RepID=A0A6P6RZ44_9EIME|nr:uncharacterized protein LOC34622531 [Cyclospora cayetanensis]
MVSVAPSSQDAFTQSTNEPLQQQLLEGPPLQRSSSSSERLFFRALMIVKIALGVFVGIIVLLALTHIDATASIVKELIARVQDLGGLAPLAYIGLYVVFIVCFMPAEFMHLVAGFIFSRIYGESLILAFNFIGSALSDLEDLDIRTFTGEREIPRIRVLGMGA